MERRHFLKGIGVGGIVLVAGCSEGDGGLGTDGDGPGTEDGGGDGDSIFDGGSDGGGDGTAGDGTDGSDGTSGDGTDGSDGTSGGGTDGSDGTSGDGTDGTASDGTDGTDGTSGDGTDGTDGTSGDGTDGTDGTSGDGTDGTDGESTETVVSRPTIGDLDPTLASSFRFEFDFSGYEGASEDARMQGHWNDGDLKATITAQGQEFTIYLVDGNSYIVAEGECFQSSPSNQINIDPGTWADPDEKEQDLQDNFERTASGQTTIDGEPMYYYVIETTRDGQTVEVTYYLHAQTGRPRRVESQGAVLNYFDWGNAPSISAPC